MTTNNNWCSPSSRVDSHIRQRKNDGIKMKQSCIFFDSFFNYQSQINHFHLLIFGIKLGFNHILTYYITNFILFEHFMIFKLNETISNSGPFFGTYTCHVNFKCMLHARFQFVDLIHIACQNDEVVYVYIYKHNLVGRLQNVQRVISMAICKTLNMGVHSIWQYHKHILKTNERLLSSWMIIKWLT